MTGKSQHLRHPELKEYRITQNMAEILYELSIAEDGEMKFGGHKRIQGRALVNRGLAYWWDPKEAVAAIDNKGLEVVKILLKLGVVKK